MGQPKQTLSGAILVAALHVFVVPTLFWSLVIGLTIAPEIFAAPSGIIFIWVLVRFINRKDDPRHANIPHEHP